MSENYDVRDTLEANIFNKYSLKDAIGIVSEKRKMELVASITDILTGKKTIHFYNGKIEIR